MAIIFWLILCGIVGEFIHDPIIKGWICGGFVYMILIHSQYSLEVRIEEKIDRLHERIDKLDNTKR